MGTKLFGKIRCHTGESNKKLEIQAKQKLTVDFAPFFYNLDALGNFHKLTL